MRGVRGRVGSLQIQQCLLYRAHLLFPLMFSLRGCLRTLNHFDQFPIFRNLHARYLQPCHTIVTCSHDILGCHIGEKGPPSPSSPNQHGCKVLWVRQDVFTDRKKDCFAVPIHYILKLVLLIYSNIKCAVLPDLALLISIQHKEL